MMRNRLDEYLETVSQPVPHADRQEWRAEVRQHLTAIATAYEKLGHSPEEATELAIARFGDAEQLGQRMRYEAARARPVPPSLKVVAALFIFQGCLCWYLTIGRIITHFFHCLSMDFPEPMLDRLGDIPINQALLIWGAPALFIGLGLLRRRPFWRSAALVLIWMTLALTLPLTFGGTNWVKDVPPPLAGWRVFMYCLVPLWQLWVLTRPQVRALFEKEPRRPSLAHG